MCTNQAAYPVRCEWGERGLAALVPGSDVVVIVDVLSFSTSVDVAVGRGAAVVPAARRDPDGIDAAARLGAILAVGRGQPGVSLSPVSLAAIQAGDMLVLPSPNGSALTLAAGSIPVLAGCLRNAAAVASAARQMGRRIAVIAAGERWPDGSLRPALEDLLGAGAILGELGGPMSPEAEAAVAAFEFARRDLLTPLRSCGSGRELIERGFEGDVAMASGHNVSACVPLYAGGAYRRAEARGFRPPGA